MFWELCLVIASDTREPGFEPSRRQYYECILLLNCQNRQTIEEWLNEKLGMSELFIFKNYFVHN